MKITKIILSLLLTTIVLSSANADESNTSNTMQGMTYAMQKSMDPQVWMQMMGMMMSPSKYASMESCALCHEGDDLARYQKDFGPMMQSMQQMTKSMEPHQMMQQMNPMMTSMMNPMMGMMNPMAMMMNPMTMMYPAMGMMGPMMGMMNPMMGMMNPMMGMMNPMMNPMMMGGMTGGMNPMGMMGGSYNNNSMSQMMKPEQYTQWFNQMTEMMKQFAPAQGSGNQ